MCVCVCVYVCVCGMDNASERIHSFMEPDPSSVLLSASAVDDRMQTLLQERDTLRVEVRLAREMHTLELERMEVEMHNKEIRIQELENRIRDLQRNREETDSVHSEELEHMRLQVRKMEDRSEEYEGQLLRWKGEVVRLLMQAREQTLSSPLSSRARETIVDREDEMEKRALEVENYRLRKSVQSLETNLRQFQFEMDRLEHEVVEAQSQAESIRRSSTATISEKDRRLFDVEAELKEYRSLINRPPSLPLSTYSTHRSIDSVTQDWLEVFMEKNRIIQSLRDEVDILRRDFRVQHMETLEASALGSIDSKSVGTNENHVNAERDSSEVSSSFESKQSSDLHANNVATLRMRLLEADKRVLTAEVEYLQRELSQVQEESKVLRREVQLLELERSGGLSNARKREILDEAEHSRNAALAYKHLTQAKVFRDLVSESLSSAATDVINYQSLISRASRMGSRSEDASVDALEMLRDLENSKDFVCAKVDTTESALAALESELLIARKSWDGYVVSDDSISSPMSEEHRVSRNLVNSTVDRSDLSLPIDGTHENFLNSSLSSLRTPAAAAAIGVSLSSPSSIQSPAALMQSPGSTTSSPSVILRNPRWKHIAGSFSESKRLSTSPFGKSS